MMICSSIKQLMIDREKTQYNLKCLQLLLFSQVTYLLCSCYIWRFGSSPGGAGEEMGCEEAHRGSGQSMQLKLNSAPCLNGACTERESARVGCLRSADVYGCKS